MGNTDDAMSDVKWHNTNQIREGYACGTVCTGGKSRAFHLALVDSSAVIPPGVCDRECECLLCVCLIAFTHAVNNGAYI